MLMNRSSSKDSLIGAGGRNQNNNNSNHNAMTNGILHHRRGMSFTKNNNAAENLNSNNNMDLFSRNRTSLPAASSAESELQVRLARLSVGSAKPAKSILDDLLASNEGGKNDYDWLLTPPGTPLVPSSDGKESQPTPVTVTARSKSSARSSSINKTSRLSVSQSESIHPSRPARSSSVTRSSISTSHYTSYSSRNNTNILNTSSTSVSSYIRPSTPTNRSSTTATRPSTPSTRTTPSRASTPSRTRPQTPTVRPVSRPQTPANLTSPTVRPVSRPSTPTRRTLSLTPSSNPRSVGSTSRPSSPSPRLRPLPPQQPISHPDFSHETPPNLRTTLPDRPLSAGRSRPKGNLETSNTGSSITRRHSSPVVTRGRVPEPSGRGREHPHSNGHGVENLEHRRTSSHLPESLTRKPIKSTSSENGTGFGRNISKKSLDMAIKHMDIRNGGSRPLSGSTLFPQSIRSSNSRTQPGRASSAPGSVDASENGNHNNGYLWNKGLLRVEDHRSPYSSKLSPEIDIYESSRYDAILLKEDSKNTSWLHSADDKIDQGPFFDNGFETLPEPF